MRSGGLAAGMVHCGGPTLAAGRYRLGDRVLLTHERTGVVKWMGTLGQEPDMLGVRLDDPMGRHDGIWRGKRYFRCTARHGAFVRRNEVLAVNRARVRHVPPHDPRPAPSHTAAAHSRSGFA